MRVRPGAPTKIIMLREFRRAEGVSVPAMEPPWNHRCRFRFAEDNNDRESQARAASGHVAAAPPSSVMNSRRFIRSRRNVERNALNLGVHRIAVNDDLHHQREAARRQLAGKIDGEVCIPGGQNLTR